MVEAISFGQTTLKWLITGAKGQLGTALSNELKSRGVRCLPLSSRDLDVTNRTAVKKLFEKERPSVIVNCAAWTDVNGAESYKDEARLINSIGAENVALGAKFIVAKNIQISTDYIFSGSTHIPYKVNDIPKPISVYGLTKLEGENRVIDAYPNASLIIRTAWLYSLQGENFLTKLLARIKSGITEINVVNDKIGQPTSAIDLARKIVEVSDNGISSGILHGTSSGSASWYEFACEITRRLGYSKVRINPVNSNTYGQVMIRPNYSVLDHDEWGKLRMKPIQDWKGGLHEILNKMEIKGTEI